MKKRKWLSILTALALGLGLLAGPALTASASGPQELADYIRDSVPGLTAAVSGSVVTVTAEDDIDVTETTLALDIDAGVTVEWRVETYSGTALPLEEGGGSLIILSGGGEFAAAGAWLEITGEGNTVYVTGDNSVIIEDYATVYAASGAAIETSTKSNATVTVRDGGSVMTDSTTNLHPAINMKNASYAGLNVTVDGGGVAAICFEETGYAIQTYGDALITNGARISAIDGRAINALGKASTVTVRDSEIWTELGIVIHTSGAGAVVDISGDSSVYSESAASNRPVILSDKGRVNVSGDARVSELAVSSANAIKSGGDVTVSGNAQVSATKGAAIYTGDGGTVDVSGGFVFAWGNGLADVVSSDPAFAGPTGDGIAVAWHTTTGVGTYVEDTSDALSIYPQEASAVWAPVAGSSPPAQIDYEKGATAGSFRLENVTLTDAPGITGPEAMTLTEGYETVSTAEFAVTGGLDPESITPEFVPAETSGITWDKDSMTLKIAEGLTEGTYTVVLKSGTVSHTFTLTVEALPPVPPSIEGDSAMTLTEGYEAVSTAPYEVTGDVTVLYSDPAIIWNADTKTLEITPGLPAGSYSVVMEADDDSPVTRSAMFTFTLTVLPATAPSPGLPGDGGGTGSVTVSFDAGGGEGSKDPVSVARGGGYTLPDNPFTRDGYRFTGWKVDGEGGLLAPGAVITVTESVTLYAQWALEGGGNVPGLLNTADHHAYMQGFGGGRFAPDESMTRAEAAQMFFNLLLEQDAEKPAGFPDVPEGVWFAEAVNTLASLGILSGFPDGGFHPQASITRAEFAAVAARFAGEAAGDQRFDDVPETHWAYAYINTAAEYGWIAGMDSGRFEPDRDITRAEAVAVVNRMLGRQADEGYVDAHGELTRFTDVPEAHWAYYDIMEAANPHGYERTGGAETWIP